MSAKHAIRRRPHPKRRFLIASTVVSVLIAGAAYAYFALDTGNGNFTTAAPSFGVVLSPPVGPPLSPGSPSQTVSFTVSNQTTTTETLSSETWAITTDADGGVFDTLSNEYVDACQADWFTIAGGDGGVVMPMQLAAGQSLTKGAVTITMPSNTADQSACENLAPQVTVTAS